MSNRLTLVQNEKPWYQKGLPFKCTGCGKCCSGAPGYIWVQEEEMEKIAQFLKISLKEFKLKFTVQVGEKYSLRDLKHQDYSCIFLKDKMCSIYSVRPRQCQTYPFWPTILKTEKNWEDEALACEGIRNQEVIVSLDEIEKKLALPER